MNPLLAVLFIIWTLVFCPFAYSGGDGCKNVFDVRTKKGPLKLSSRDLILENSILASIVRSEIPERVGARSFFQNQFQSLNETDQSLDRSCTDILDRWNAVKSWTQTWQPSSNIAHRVDLFDIRSEHDFLMGEPTILGVFEGGQSDSKTTLGFWAASLHLHTGQLSVFTKYFGTADDNSALLSRYFFTFYDQLLHQLGVNDEQMDAQWSGRLAWAKRYELDPDFGVTEGSAHITQIELLRRNFLRFLANHSISLDSLTIQEPGKTPTRLDPNLENLRQPLDFARVISTKGAKILQSRYIAKNTLSEPRLMPIGLAFVLADNRSYIGQSRMIDVGGENFSDCAMPKWRGLRFLNGETSRELRKNFQTFQRMMNIQK